MAIILGILQGITEWLPISSSGHLAIFQHYFEEEPPILFDVILHLGSLLVVSYILKDEISDFLGAAPSIVRKINGKSSFNEKERLVLLVATASVPTALFGLAFDGDIIQNFYEEMYLVGTCLIITGIVIWFSKNYNNNLSFFNLSYSKTFCVGVVQGLSLIHI